MLFVADVVSSHSPPPRYELYIHGGVAGRICQQPSVIRVGHEKVRRGAIGKVGPESSDL
jgi:hypothetical protein